MNEFSPPQAPRQAVLNAASAGAWETVGGIPLAARFLYHLDSLGIEEVILVVEKSRHLVSLRRWQGRMTLREVYLDAGENLASVAHSTARLAPRILYADAAHLMDRRLLAALAVAPAPTMAYIDRNESTCGVVRAGVFSPEEIRIWAEEGSTALANRSAPLLPEDVDPFSPELRGPRTPYFREVHPGEDVRQATRFLVRSQQKFVMDLPAEFIDPLFEDPLTCWLSSTRITPNMVSMTGALTAFLVAWLFWNGYFVTGAFLMFLVEILDGVDGKLARTKLQFSRFGRHEDVLDYFCETSIYVGLGAGLTAGYGGSLPCFLAVLMIVSDTIDNVLYTLAGKWYGKSIDLFSPFDTAFRRIGGRRNIYGAIFIIGFLAGFPLQTFALASFWAAVTATVHAVRLAQFGREDSGSAG